LQEPSPMEDPVEESTKDMQAWLVQVSKGEAKRLQDDAVSNASISGVEVLVLRSDMVFGSDHLRSALFHAKKATSEGRNASESLAMETLLYASGERQLSAAIKKMSIDSSSSEVALVQLTPGRFDTGESWKPMPAVRADVPLEDLSRFGISREELATVKDRRTMDIVLEKVASVDVLKK
jgi:tRNA threonylcarbamoyladenosine modification (KEOPS) complex Cgi121 subunit